MPRHFTGQGGPNDRPLRYSAQKVVRLLPPAMDDLVEMGKDTGTKPAVIMRRATMKDIYIWKANKAKREAAVLEGQLSLTDIEEKKK